MDKEILDSLDSAQGFKETDDNEILKQSLAGMFEEVTAAEQRGNKTGYAPKIDISAPKRVISLEERTANLLQAHYKKYLQHELPDQDKSMASGWSEDFETVVNVLYPQDNILLVPVVKDYGLYEEPVFRQQFCSCSLNKENIGRYLQEKTQDTFITTTEFFKKMPEQMELVELIKRLGNLGTELLDFARDVLSKNTQGRFSLNPYVLALSLPPEQRAYYTAIIEEDVRAGNIVTIDQRAHFQNNSPESRRLTDRFELFKRAMKRSLPSLTSVNEILKRYNLTQDGMEKVVQWIQTLTITYIKPWREIIESKEREFQQLLMQQRVQEKRDRWMASGGRIIKADELETYLKYLENRQSQP